MKINKKAYLVILVLYFSGISICKSLESVVELKNTQNDINNAIFAVSYQDLIDLTPNTLEKIIASSRRYGSFILKIDDQRGNSLLQIKQCALKFFSSPLQQKQEVAVKKGSSRGFVDLRNPNEGNFLEMFAYGLLDPSKTNKWPKSFDCMEKLCMSHIKDLHKIGIEITKEIYSYFKLDPEFITMNSLKSKTGATLNYYPVKNNHSIKSLIKEHIDFGLLGIVHTFGSGGLEIFDYDKNLWIPVSYDSDNYIVNIGGMLSLLVKGKIKPCLHRVIKKQNTDRLSINVFVELDKDAKIDLQESGDRELKNIQTYGDAIRIIEKRYFGDQLRNDKNNS